MMSHGGMEGREDLTMKSHHVDFEIVFLLTMKSHHVDFFIDHEVTPRQERDQKL